MKMDEIRGKCSLEKSDQKKCLRNLARKLKERDMSGVGMYGERY
jgi:hypothetical protein